MIRLPLLAVAALVVLVGGCGGKSGGSKAATPVVSMQGLRFHPPIVEVHVGQRVRWSNADDVDHNVTAVAGATFKSQAFGRGGSYSFAATHPGAVKYVCTLHPGMSGTIKVAK